MNDMLSSRDTVLLCCDAELHSGGSGASEHSVASLHHQNALISSSEGRRTRSPKTKEATRVELKGSGPNEEADRPLTPSHEDLINELNVCTKQDPQRHYAPEQFDCRFHSSNSMRLAVSAICESS